MNESPESHAPYEALMSAGAVSVNVENEFEFVSGLRGPIYVDSRRIISYPKERLIILQALEGLINTDFIGPSAIAGIATGGIPWAAWVAHDLRLPLLYVRPAAKPRGMGRQIEGKFDKDDRILLVEDVITTGLSTAGCAEAIQSAGATVLGAVSIFSYELPFAKRCLSSAGMDFRPLITFPMLLRIGADYFTSVEMDVLRSWQTQVLPAFIPKG